MSDQSRKCAPRGADIEQNAYLRTSDVGKAAVSEEVNVNMRWEDNVRKVVPYTAGEQPKDHTLIKLNTNECPYPPSTSVKVAAGDLAKIGELLRLYPDMNATMLTQALAQDYDVDPEQIFVGVGSDDVLAMSFLTFFTSGKRILFPDITYSFYDVWANLYRIPYTAVPLRNDFSIDPENYIPASPKYAGRKEHKQDMGGSIEDSGSGDADVMDDADDVGGIIFPNPNAPTGVELPLESIEKIVAANPDKVVIVDEAYVDFGAVSAQKLLPRYENLLIVQTFSKSRALAGLRVGFALGNRKLIGYLKDVKFSFNSYTMSLPAILLATAAAKDQAYFHSITDRIIQTREWFKKECKALGFDFPDSRTNFLFVHHPEMPAEEIMRRLRERRIIVRHFDAPRIHDYLRITIGTDEQMRYVVKALHEILGR